MRLLITGSNGQLGQEFYRIKSLSKHKFLFTDYNRFNICSIDSINSYMSDIKVDCIINCAAYTDVRKAEVEREKAFDVNSNGVKNLVTYCEDNNVKLIHFSTDYVYNSLNKKPINENELIDPTNYYGFSKREGEKHIENSKSESIVIRTSWLYSKYGNNFVNTIIDKSKTTENLKVVSDQFGCPTYAKDLAEAVMQISVSKERIDKEAKIFNYSNEGSTSWFNFAKKILLLYGSDSKIEPVNSKFFKNEVKRPKFSITSKQKIIDTFNLKINNWDSSLTNYIINDLK
ncbi:MAG: dTDP-4-dehydrorhamnose reductase [Flavobacteriaceae bacterium]|nr:dTDP-4-dehydrorhamnose reductase [Flavobacteriaceae bacterium]MBL6685088.1 dTDP-4-dehydrorhamnose reductase [Flavobacteriaceae bacterium]